MLPPGKASLNLLKLIPEIRLFLEIEKLVHKVERNGEPARQVSSSMPKATGQRRSEYRSDSSGRRTNGAFLVLFEPAPAERRTSSPILTDRDT